MWRECSLDSNNIPFLGMDFAARLFGQNVLIIFQDNGPSAETIGGRFLQILILGTDYAANVFQPTKGSLRIR
jgi:hypothetical protein